MTADRRSEVMLARWAARRARRTRRSQPRPGPRDRVGEGRGREELGRGIRLAAAHVADAGYTVGVLDADIWGFSVPRMLGLDDRLEAKVVERRPTADPPPTSGRSGAGTLKVVSTGLLVEDEGTALVAGRLMLTKAVEQFLRDVHWGRSTTS